MSPKRDASGRVLDVRALNRALLARQQLLRRAAMPAEDMVAHLLGMQAQAPTPPYHGLWTRIAGFTPDALATLLTDRRAVRLALMRSTIHLVTADDACALRPLLQPVLDRGLRGAHGRALAGLDLDAVAAAGRSLVDDAPRTFEELGAALRERWPERDGRSLGAVVRTRVPLVQVPPRGLWGASGAARHTSLERWLGRTVDPAPSIDEVVLRYLAAYGPASAMDVQGWSGLTRLGAVLTRLRPRLATFRDEHGRELFDLPDAPRPDGDVAAPVRFVPEFDGLLLAHADRTRIISDTARARVFTINGQIHATVLVDGFVRGTWSIAHAGDHATLTVQPHARLARAERAALEDEGARLLAFGAADAAHHAVRFAPAS